MAFYQALTTGYSGENRKITGGCSLAMAFAQAEGLSKAARGGKSRDFVAATPSHEEVTDDDGFPWIVQYRKGSEHVARWNLFEDDPLFGLPDLPADIGWPVEPYRNLEYFQRDHARIFFGRGRAIRELYNLLTLPAESAESRLIFYYGQTGVGKTSVLAAGLLPRVEALFATRYCRRSAQDGLLGTLRATLAPGAEPFDLGAAWLEIEDKAKRPLLIVLDQAEEAFTRPRADSRPQDEVRALFEAVREAFAPTRTERPQGRLILSFRKEWLAEFNEIRKASNLDIKPMMLDPLDRPGVIEAIEGPAEHFGLVISPDRNSVEPGETTLAEFMSRRPVRHAGEPPDRAGIADRPHAPDLVDPDVEGGQRPEAAAGPAHLRSRVVPGTEGEGLQARRGDPGAVRQDRGGRGPASRRWRRGCCWTCSSSSRPTRGRPTRTRARRSTTATPLQPAERLDALLEACQNRYLLAHVGVGEDGTPAYRLTHDTLAPLLRERFRVSPGPGPACPPRAGWAGGDLERPAH